MKSLVTGAGGWLGSELVKELLQNGKNVRAFVLRDSEKLNSLKVKFNNQLEIVYGDICNESDINKALNQIDIVYHLAAKVHSIANNLQEEEVFYKVNTEASKNLFELCIKKSIKRVVFYSSVSVYGEYQENINIESEKKPITVYAKSKLEAEKIGIKLFSEKGLPITIIEPVTVYGGNDIGNFNKLNNLAKLGITVKFGNGDNLKSVIYYRDLIIMTIRISEDEKMVGKCIICGTEKVSINSLNNILRNNYKVFLNLKFNQKLTDCIYKFLKSTKIQFFSKIARQIKVLNSSNDYDIKEAQKYKESYMKIKDYYKMRE